MPAYEWFLLRVVPRVDRGEFVNVGAVVHCQELDFLRAAIHFEPARVLALDPALDMEGVRRHLDAVVALAEGRAEAGPLAAGPPARRFAFLAAPSSTVVQPSPLHTGVTDDPAAELERLLDTLVRPPEAA